MSILDDLRAAMERVRPTLYYVVTDSQIGPGHALRILAHDMWPELWIFHYLDFAEHAAGLSVVVRLVDFHAWQPTPAPGPPALRTVRSTGGDDGL